MNIILATLNSKYIHSSLSIRYLKSYSEDCFPNIKIMEYTINQNEEYITGEIYKANPDIVAFSCYIWNIQQTINIANALKLVNNNIKIIFGGPEVSFDSSELMTNYPFIDFIIYGEGEETFKGLLLELKEDGSRYDKIDGLIFREEDNIISNNPRNLIMSLDTIPSPFNKDLDAFKNRIVYYESSRGCPFNCKFCLSSTIKGVRFFSLDRVKYDLKKLIEAEVRQVKFVDRTFNARKDYALEIMSFIKEINPKNINFHFEVTAHLLDDEVLRFLEDTPEGLFQFEIGVQTTNPKALKEVSRVTDFNILSSTVKEIKKFNNIHIHLDLIAGLPFENYISFKKSFDDVYFLKPDQLQLGFLKLLKGSELRTDKELYEYRFVDNPPYEILENKYVSYSEVLRLKIIEDLVERYYNSGGFQNSIQFLIKYFYASPFSFFEAFSLYWENMGYHSNSHSKQELYRIVLDFAMRLNFKYKDQFLELLRYDYIFNNMGANIPPYLGEYMGIDLKKARHEFLKNQDYIDKYLPLYSGKGTKNIINHVHFESFRFNILDFLSDEMEIQVMRYDDSIVLFEFIRDDRALVKCNTYDVTKEFESVRRS